MLMEFRIVARTGDIPNEIIDCLVKNSNEAEIVITEKGLVVRMRDNSNASIKVYNEIEAVLKKCTKYIYYWSRKIYYAAVKKKITAEMVADSQLYDPEYDRYTESEIGNFTQCMGLQFNDISEVWAELKLTYPNRPLTDFEITIHIIPEENSRVI